MRDLLSFITKTFDGKDKEFVAWAMLEYAWLPYDAIETEERYVLVALFHLSSYFYYYFFLYFLLRIMYIIPFL